MNFQAYTLQKHPEWACIQVKAPDSEARTPVHLCCVIDTSASMESERKLENVKQSLQFLLDFLGPQDSISVITFSEKAHTILKQTAVTSTEKDNIRARISIIHVESNTNLSAGIVKARDSLQIDSSNIKQGILLLTDGVANLGLTRPSDILELVRNTINKFSGTSISSVGYGTDHNVELLQNISTEGGGSYYVVNNLEDVAVVFGDILGGLVSCASQQVRVIIPSGTEVKTRYATHTNGNKLEIVIGDMPAGMEAAFLAKITINTPVSVKGYNLQTHEVFELNTTVVATDDNDLQVNGEAHYLRFEVLTLLEASRTLLNRFANTTDVNAHIQKIKDCIDTINNYRRDHEHSLWDVLLEELNTCKTSLENRHQNPTDTPHIMTQHAGYLGRMRGLAATASQAPNLSPPFGAVPSDPSAVPPPLPIGRTFSNYVQRQISSGLAATVTPYARQNAVSTSDPIHLPSNRTLTGSIPTPTPNRSPVTRFVTQLPPPIPEDFSLHPLLPPMGPLERQVACGYYTAEPTNDSN